MQKREPAAVGPRPAENQSNGAGPQIILPQRASGVDFDERTHTYSLDGRRLPSVTEILAATGFCEWLKKVPARTLEKATFRGQAVHRAAQLLDLGTLDHSTVRPEYQGYLWGYQVWLAESGFRPRLIEHRFHHPIYQYAGTLDREGVMDDGTEAVVDIKTGLMGRFRMLAAGLQLVAYTHSFEHPLGLRRIGLELRADGKYRVHEAKKSEAARDFRVFLSAMTVANYRRGS